MTLKTTIIIPALNEGSVIGAVVRQLRACEPLQRAGITDIVVIDNGSDDDTAAVAREAGARVVREPQRGYGRACRAGMLATDADIIVQMDGDGSDVPEDILRVWQPVHDGVADLAMGSRVRGRHERGALTPQQIAGNAVGALLLRGLYGVRVTDIGPLRAIRRDALVRMQMAEMTYGWSVEMLAKAGRLGLRIQEVPVDYRRRAGGASKVAGTLSGTFKASWRILRTLGTYTRWEGAAPPPDPLPTQAWGGGEDRTSLRLSNFRPSPVVFPSPSAVVFPSPSAGWGGVRGGAAVLFIVARLPVAGQTKTRLGNVIGQAAAAELYGAFLRDLGARFTAAAARDGYDLCWFAQLPPGTTEADFARWVPPGGFIMRQPEGDFAGRLWHGFQALRARGYDRITVLGSDSPHVPAAAVASAFAKLATHATVIGPAQDGGYYLLGQRGAPADLFTDIPMSVSSTYAATVRRNATLERSLAYLPVSFDIDEIDDLNRLQAALCAAPSPLADPAPATLARLNMLLAAEPVALEAAHEE